jgi:hypothetical protein
VGEDADEEEGEDAYEDTCGDVGDQDPKETPYPQADEDSGCINCPNKRATGCANSMCEGAIYNCTVLSSPPRTCPHFSLPPSHRCLLTRCIPRRVGGWCRCRVLQ